MAEVLIDALSLGGSASTGGKITAVKTSDSALNGLANIVGKLTLIVFDETAVSGNATSTTQGRALRLIRGGLTGRAAVGSSGHKYKTVKAVLLGGSILEAYTFDRDIKTEIGDYLPALYRDMEDVEKLSNVDATEVIRLRAYLNSLLDNFYVVSADSLLDRWEREVGIEAIPQRSADSRRHFIEAKLRGRGVTSQDSIKSIVDAFYTSEVTEKPRINTVDIKLVGRRGIPKNLEDINVAVTDVIPAHIATNYEFTYMPWVEVDAVLKSWDQVDGQTMEEASVKSWLAFESEKSALWEEIETLELTMEELEESYDINTMEVNV